MVAWAIHLRDLSICNELRYLELRSLTIHTNKKLQRLILCFIDFADPSGPSSTSNSANLWKLVLAFWICRNKKQEPLNVEHAFQAAEAVTAAAAASAA